MAEEQGLLVDVDGFNKAMKEARDISKNAQNKVSNCLTYLFSFSRRVFDARLTLEDD